MFVKLEEIKPNLLYSPMDDEGDTRPADIYTFPPSEYPELTNKLNEYSKTLNNRDDHRLLTNYINVDFFTFPFVTMYQRGSTITGFATGWNRDFYLKGSIRILNRFYHDKETSRIGFTRELLRPSTFHCVQQQIILAERLGYSFAFISREMRATKFFKRFINALDDRSTHSWEFREGPFLVAPNPPDPSCWQSIGMTKLKPTANKFWSSWNNEIN